MIPEVVTSRSSNCIKEVRFIFLLRFHITLRNAGAESYCFFGIFHCIVYGPVRTPASYKTFMVGERFGITYNILNSCAEYLFFERFVKESLDTEISVSGIEGIPCRHIQFRTLILPAGHFDFCNDTYRSIGDDTFRAGLHRSDVYCFLSIPTFQGTRTAAVKYPQHIIPESFG